MVCCSFLPLHRFVKDRTVLGDASQQLWAFLSHSWTFSSLAWAFGLDIKMGRGIQIPWLHNSPSKSCCPDSRTGRRVLTSSGFLTGLSSLVICWRLRLFRLLTTCFWRFGILSMSPLNSGGFVFPTLDGVMAIKRQGFLQPLWARKTRRLP